MDPGTFDVVSTMTTAGTTVSTQILAVLGAIVPVVIGIVAAKLGVTKGIGLLKTLVGKS